MLLSGNGENEVDEGKRYDDFSLHFSRLNEGQNISEARTVRNISFFFSLYKDFLEALFFLSESIKKMEFFFQITAS